MTYGSNKSHAKRIKELNRRLFFLQVRITELEDQLWNACTYAYRLDRFLVKLGYSRKVIELIKKETALNNRF